MTAGKLTRMESHYEAIDGFLKSNASNFLSYIREGYITAPLHEISLEGGPHSAVPFRST